MRVRYAREAMAVFILVIAVVALYYTFVPTSCGDYACFEAHMARCSSAVFVNEEDEATWKYAVLGTVRRTCETEVTLLNAKEGEVDLRKYEGAQMRCYYELGVTGFPEKNLVACHGPLKEAMQEIAIGKLYKYIVANLGEIKEELLF